jgi:hypothetical protein
MSSETPGKPTSETLDIKPPLTSQSEVSTVPSSLSSGAPASSASKSQSQPLVIYLDVA